MSKIRPLGSNLLVRRAPAEERSAGGLYIPDTAQKPPQRGVVVAAGPGRKTEAGNLIPNDIKEGDVVLFAEGLGREVKVDGETLVVINEDLIMATVEA